ncbi:two-component system sensor histidine kinase CreC [Chiayiivirga flava]|uniref:histidine kinase n=1 Tax=Chiayiivirga flava TaxID=659595 RepID=A0A7W8D564_9GAMM|nr:two-component system sensor histidine kinase CreC [Chiayiivirga flava]MBB5208120.1 two-component system sensor histidine kinase CreC [Chiayiivirga flava]
MNIGLRVLLGYFLIVGLAALLVTRVFVQEVKPGVRQAMEDTLVDTAHVLARLATADFLAGRIADGDFARDLRAIGAGRVDAEIWQQRKRSIDYRVYITDAKGIVVFDSSGRDVGADYSRWNDVFLTLRGRYGARSSRSDPADEASTVMYVAAPIKDGERIVGALTVAKPNAAMQPFIARSEATVRRWGLVLMGGAFVIGLAITGWLSRALARLTAYARAVADGQRVAAPGGAGEIGELSRALERMRAQLDGRDYAERYVHTLTHEMKSPLAAIRGAAELLDDLGMPPDARARFTGNIRTQAARLTALIDQLLALAELEQRPALARVEDIDALALVPDVIATFEPRLAHEGKRIELVPLPRDGSAATRPPLRGDAFLLRQALTNLLDNALDFSPAGALVTLELEQAEVSTIFRVVDTGHGIPEYARERVFERFYSLPRRTDGPRSSGLGLCFVREIAELHHGGVTLDNRADGVSGAVATLRVPLRS